MTIVKKAAKVNDKISQEEIEILKKEESSLLERAKKYNEEFMDIPDNYKSFVPAPNMMLVRLKLAEQPKFDITSFEQETNAPRGTLMNWYAMGDSLRGHGVVVAGSLPFGTKVTVSPATFYGQNWIISKEHVFETPEHTLPGFFLMPKNFILGTY